MVTIVIPCKHESGEEPNHRVKVPDYHPLSKGEIKELLDIASKTADEQDLAKIKERLVQGIKGMTCPRPDNHRHISWVLAEVQVTFNVQNQEGGTPELVDRFDKLLNW